MEPAILLVDHGSRAPEANAVLDGIAALLRERLPGRRVYVAHMELASPSLAEALEACAADGMKEVSVLPYFLAPGRHSAGDIPRLAAEAAERHPDVTVRVAEPLGVHPALIDVILDRINAGGGSSRSG